MISRCAYFRAFARPLALRICSQEINRLVWMPSSTEHHIHDSSGRRALLLVQRVVFWLTTVTKTNWRPGELLPPCRRVTTQLSFRLIRLAHSRRRHFPRHPKGNYASTELDASQDAIPCYSSPIRNGVVHFNRVWRLGTARKFGRAFPNQNVHWIWNC
jgi:hypothetical protein